MRTYDNPFSGHPAKLSRVALGTAAFGTKTPEDVAFSLMDRYAALGGNVFDTGYCYGDWTRYGEGASERTIGAWLQARDTRDRAFIVTKGAHPDFKSCQSKVTERDIASDIEESLERLGVDTIDLYFLHRDDPSIPAGEILSWLQEPLQSGKLGSIGASNWSVSRMLEATRAATEIGFVDFAASQIGWSLARRENPIIENKHGIQFTITDEFQRYHEDTGRPLFGFTSQARGFFAKDRMEDEGSLKSLEAFNTEQNERRFQASKRLAKSIGVTPVQINIAYLTNQPFKGFPIIGPTTIEQLNESMGGADIPLTDADLAALEV